MYNTRCDTKQQTNSKTAYQRRFEVIVYLFGNRQLVVKELFSSLFSLGAVFLVDHGSEGGHYLVLFLQPLFSVEVCQSSPVVCVVDLVLLTDTHCLHTTMPVDTHSNAFLTIECDRYWYMQQQLRNLSLHTCVFYNIEDITARTCLVQQRSRDILNYRPTISATWCVR